jgi:putative hydrolase of the HAD superfamily
MVVKAVLFDLDGTLTERSLKPPEELARILNLKGIDVSAEKIEKACSSVAENYQTAIGEQRGTVSHQELYCMWEGYFFKALGLDSSVLSRSDLHWSDVGIMRAYPDVIPTLNQLKARGVYLGIISDAYQAEIHHVLTMAKVDTALFDIIVGPDTAHNAKPHPGAFLYAVRMLGIKSEEAVFVGNELEKDYKAAEKVGMNPLLIVRAEKRDLPADVHSITQLVSLIDYLDEQVCSSP